MANALPLAFAHEEATSIANFNFASTLTAAELAARGNGRFFTLWEEICEHQDTQIVPSRFPNITRTVDQGCLLYPNTTNLSYLAALQESTTEKSDATNTTQTTTCVDFLYNVEGDKVHFLSNAKICHAAYLQLGQPATGLFSDDYSIRRKLLNGIKKTRRLNDSGIKHSKFNKFYLKMSRNYLDHDPPYLIVFPLLSLNDVLGWDGVTPYSALVLPCGARGRSAATDVLSKVREVSTEREVRTAVETLAVFVKNIAESLLDTDHDILEDFDETVGNSNDVSIVRWKALVRHLRQASHPTISIPVLRTNLDFQTIRVAKGTFDINKSCLPDPYLVAIKAAINFSAHVGTKLMPACPKYESDEDA